MRGAAVAQQIGEGAAVRQDARRFRGERAVDDAVLGDDAGQIHLGDHLDDARAADAGDAERLRPPRRSRARRTTCSTPMTLKRGSSVSGIDAHALDGAGGGALAAGDLGAFEGRPGGRGGGEHAVAVSEHDLGVGADIDEQHHVVLAMRAFRRAWRRPRRRRHGRRCRAGYRRACPSLQGEVEFLGRGVHGARDGEREGRAAQLGRVDAEEEMMHDRIADEDAVEDVVALDRRLPSSTLSTSPEIASRTARVIASRPSGFIIT